MDSGLVGTRDSRYIPAKARGRLKHWRSFLPPHRWAADARNIRGEP